MVIQYVHIAVVQRFPIYRHFHLCSGRNIIIRHRKIFCFLNVICPTDSQRCSINHMKRRHRFRQQLVPVKWRAIACFQNILNFLRNKIARIGKFEPVLKFIDINSATQLIIGVSNTIIEQLAHHQLSYCSVSIGNSVI